MSADRFGSILTRQARASLHLWATAKAAFEADRAAGFAPALPFDRLSRHEREAYLAAAEAEIAAPPTFPIRDAVVGRDQVTRAERARVLTFGGSHV